MVNQLITQTFDRFVCRKNGIDFITNAKETMGQTSMFYTYDEMNLMYDTLHL